jgi:hypothetical protein
MDTYEKGNVMIAYGFAHNQFDVRVAATSHAKFTFVNTILLTFAGLAGWACSAAACVEVVAARH